jgi:hypothetical protein
MKKVLLIATFAATLFAASRKPEAAPVAAPPESITITVADLMGAMPALAKLNNTPFLGAPRLRLLRLSDAVQTEAKRIDAARQQFNTDEKTTVQDGQRRIKPEYLDAWMKFLGEKVVLAAAPIPESDLDAVSLTPNEVRSLKPLLGGKSTALAAIEDQTK